MPMSWTPENERKFMLRIIHLVSMKDIDIKELATHFPGATPRAIYEHLKIVRKEAQALVDAPAGTSSDAGNDEKGSEEQSAKRGRKRKADMDVGDGDMGAVVKKKMGSKGLNKKGNGKEVQAKVEMEMEADVEGGFGEDEDDA